MAPYLRLATVGLGKVASFHLSALQAQPIFKLVSACDIDSSKQVILQDPFLDIPFFTNYEQMLQTVDFDAVVVATPTPIHYATAIQVLNSGKHLLLEKPATLNLQDLEYLIGLAKSKDLVFVVAFHDAFAQELQWFLENYQSSFIKKWGPLTGFTSGFFDNYLVNGRLQDCAQSLGSSWFDSGINALSVMTKLVRDLAVLEGRFTRIPQFGVEDVQASVEFSFSVDESDQAGRGLIETNWCAGINRKTTRLFFAQSKVEVVLHHTLQEVLLIDEHFKRTQLAKCSGTRYRLVDQYISVFTDFSNHIHKRTTNLDFTMRAHQLLVSAQTAPIFL